MGRQQQLILLLWHLFWLFSFRIVSFLSLLIACIDIVCSVSRLVAETIDVCIVVFFPFFSFCSCFWTASVKCVIRCVYTPIHFSAYAVFHSMHRRTKRIPNKNKIENCNHASNLPTKIYARDSFPHAREILLCWFWMRISRISARTHWQAMSTNCQLKVDCLSE